MPRGPSQAVLDRERRQADLANVLLIRALEQMGVDTKQLIDELIAEYRVQPSMRWEARANRG